MKNKGKPYINTFAELSLQNPNFQLQLRSIFPASLD